MKCLDLTLPTPQENLACDEALLDECEEGCGHEMIRFWEFARPFVVLGYANRVEREVKQCFCQKNHFPILRRRTGGGSVVQGAGCFNFSLILKIPEEGPLGSITGTNAYILERHRQALREITGMQVAQQGSSDLTHRMLKFSGNAQHRKRRFFLFHGTFLLEFDLPLVERLLPMPSRQPLYRQNRSHLDFLGNLPLSVSTIKGMLAQAWNAHEPLREVPWERITHLARQRYASDAWTYKF